MPRPGPISNTWSLRLQFCQRDDFAHDVGIDQKVLAEPFVRRRGMRNRHRSIPAGRTRRCLPQLFHQIGKRGSEIVDEIGKLFHQIVGKGWPRLQGGKLLPFFLAQGFGDDRIVLAFHFATRSTPATVLSVSMVSWKICVQFLQLLLNQSKPAPIGSSSSVILAAWSSVRNETDLRRSTYRPLANLAASVIASTRLPGSAMPFPTISNAVP